MLAAVLDPAHRMVELERQRRDGRLLGRQARLRAKAAADVGRDHADAALLEIEHLGQSQPDDVRDLRRAVDDELVEPMVAMRQHGAAFERHRDLPVHPVAAPYHHLGVAGDLFDIAAAELAFDEQVVAPALVHQAGRFIERGRGVDDGGQQFVIDGHQAREVLGFGAGRREAGGDAFADEPHLVGGERRIARDLEARHLRDRAHLGQARQVLCGEHPAGGVGRNSDALDARMRVRAAHERYFLRAGKLHVGDELAAAVEVAGVLLAQQRGADTRLIVGLGLHDAAAPWARLPAPASLASSASARAAAAMAVTMLV